LPLIGLSRARKIVAFRNANGPFRSVEELLNVPGIGMGTVKAVRPLVITR
jgi:competence protein ComEA